MPRLRQPIRANAFPVDASADLNFFFFGPFWDGERVRNLRGHWVIGGTLSNSIAFSIAAFARIPVTQTDATFVSEGVQLVNDPASSPPEFLLPIAAPSGQWDFPVNFQFDEIYRVLGLRIALETGMTLQGVTWVEADFPDFT